MCRLHHLSLCVHLSDPVVLRLCGSSDITLDEFMGPSESGFKFLPFDLIMLLSIALLMWYSFQPMYMFYTRDALLKVHRLHYAFLQPQQQASDSADAAINSEELAYSSAPN